MSKDEAQAARTLKEPKEQSCFLISLGRYVNEHGSDMERKI